MFNIFINFFHNINYTMDTQIKETTVNIKEMNNDYVNHKYKQNNNDIIIPSKSLIVYIENETSQIPEILLDIFKIANIHSNDWYIYGVKNHDFDITKPSWI